MKKALVTGHRGFVGRHMMHSLLESGWSVLGIDIKDATEFYDVRNFFRKNETHYDLVIHCAAVVGGRQMIENSPLQLAATDLSIDAGLFNWAVKTNPGRIIYFSSSAAYPIWRQTHENHTKLKEYFINLNYLETPDETYGWVKLTGEMLADKARQYGLKITTLRPFSGYGETQDLDYPFPSFIQRAEQKKNPFLIWGDGTQVRDWVHINDIVEMTMTCIENQIDGPLNIGNGIGISFLQLQEKVCSIAGYKPRIQLKLDAPKGVSFRVADTTEMSKVYQPKISIEEGIERALKYV